MGTIASRPSYIFKFANLERKADELGPDRGQMGGDGPSGAVRFAAKYPACAKPSQTPSAAK
jgi:hypothetical protein